MEKSLVYGLKCSELSVNYDPNSSSWKTYQLSLYGDYQEFSGTWPASGMIANGKLFQLVNLEPYTKESVGLLLPTPRAHKPEDWNYHAWKTREEKHGKIPDHIEIRLREIYGEMGSGKKARLNHRFICWIMGFPIDWLD